MVIVQIQGILFNAVRSCFPDLPCEQDWISISYSSQKTFGHYQCNAMMRLAKSSGQSPRKMAELVAIHLNKYQLAHFSKIEVAGPGFINMWLNPQWISQCVAGLAKDPMLGVSKVAPKKVIIDFSSPNIAKQMHVGHLRSTIIGDCLRRLYQFKGYQVLALNHIGDWGTAFGMLIAYLIKIDHPLLTDADAKISSADLLRYYRQSKVLFDEDDVFKTQAREAVTSLQQGKKLHKKLWEKICSISRDEYQIVYDTLNIDDLLVRGESFYQDLCPKVVKDFKVKGLLTESQGARCVFLPTFTQKDGRPLPLIIQKSDGGYNYTTTDLAALKQRMQIESASSVIYVTDLGQKLHFDMLFAAGSTVGYITEQVSVEHVGFGLVLGKDGKKLKTRSGETLPLIDLLQGAIEKAKTIISTKQVDIQPSSLLEQASILGINAVKYADLSCPRQHDYAFSYDRMLRFEGNTAPYLMYAYVRIMSIQRKAPDVWLQAQSANTLTVSDPSEISLAIHLMRFPDAIDALMMQLMPNRLTDYLYQLAVLFHQFFRDCHVLGSQEENSRMLLCYVAHRVFKQGFDLLGLRLLTTM